MTSVKHLLAHTLIQQSYPYLLLVWHWDSLYYPLGQFVSSHTTLSSDGTVVAIGAPNNDNNGVNSGHVRIFRLNSSDNWVQVGSDINGESSYDLSGGQCLPEL